MGIQITDSEMNVTVTEFSIALDESHIRCQATNTGRQRLFFLFEFAMFLIELCFVSTLILVGRDLWRITEQKAINRITNAPFSMSSNHFYMHENKMCTFFRRPLKTSHTRITKWHARLSCRIDFIELDFRINKFM